MKPNSVTLFHFTRNIETLKSILINGFYPNYCLEDITWHEYNNPREFIAFPVVSFCDIPISRINEHVNFYGSYGIGLKKEWGIKNELNPLMYFSKNNILRKAIMHQHVLAAALTDASKKDLAFRNLRHTLSFTKPLSGKMIINGLTIEKDFYQESEWRYVPFIDSIPQFMHSDEYNDEEIRKQNNDLLKMNCKLKFDINDIKYIFVSSDDDIPVIMNFIQTELDKNNSADLKVLMSRVTSLESIQNDI